MNRSKSIQHLDLNHDPWDLIIIGGGATGLGIALDAGLRGYRTLLLEQADFTKGTSSRSTKLVHGGVRYLAQGNLKLVLEALEERGLLLQNAPHLCSNQSFVVPSYSWLDSLFYTVGLKIYDLLAGTLSLGKSEWVSANRAAALLPNIKKEHLKSGIVYHDGQFDDARLGINLAQSASEQGVHLINYMKVVGLNKNSQGKVASVAAVDLESDRKYQLQAKSIINATGVFVDDVLHMDDAQRLPIVRVSQGAHIVLDRSFLPSDHALMIPKTSDGRVLFAVPWHDKLVVGTTDTLVDAAALEPKALNEEVAFILDTFSAYARKKPTPADVLSVFAGLRPLARPHKGGQKTKEISRSHKLLVSPSDLITITGGKWTTYRKMAQEVVDKAADIASLPRVACTTQHFKIHGHTLDKDADHPLGIYGSDRSAIEALIKTDARLAEKLHGDYHFVKAEVVWAVRNEMARTVEDVLSRRLRLLFMDARAAISVAETVAALMGPELQQDAAWEAQQVSEFRKLARQYLLPL